MRVCYFGGYDQGHPRNRVMMLGLARCGAQVTECHSRHPVKSLRPFILTAKYLRMFRRVDVVVVGASCHAYVPLAWLLCRLTRKPLIFDAFVSFFEIWTEETGQAKPSGLKGWSSFLLDWIGLHLSDRFLLDTEEHVLYFRELFRGPAGRVRCVLIGADDGAFRFEKTPSPGFRVLFSGAFLPLHGIDVILRAAEILRDETDLRIEMLGPSRLADACDLPLRAPNLELVGPVPYEEYARRLRRADAALGVFGATPKAGRVVPCKIYESLAAGVPLISREGPSVGRFLRSGQHALLIPAGDPKALAEAILLLKRDPQLRQRLAAEGRRVFERIGTPERIGRELLRLCEEVSLRP